MTNSYKIFEGAAHIYLYGQNALIPVNLHDCILKSVIGRKDSDLIVNEHREATIQTIRNIPANCYPNNFLKVFNQLARVEIRYEPNKHGLEIDLYESTTEVAMSILWMGVLNNNSMPAYEVEWEIFKPIDDNNTAFCALVKTQPIAESN